MNNYHLRRNKTASSKKKKNIWKATWFIPYGEYGPPSDAHALRVDHGRAQKSCNGAIYCRPSLLEHAPGKHQLPSDLWEMCDLTVSHQPLRSRSLSHKHTNSHTHSPALARCQCRSQGFSVMPWGKFRPCGDAWGWSQEKTEKSLVFRNSHSELTNHLLQLGLCNLTLK